MVQDNGKARTIEYEWPLGCEALAYAWANTSEGKDFCAECEAQIVDEWYDPQVNLLLLQSQASISRLI
jgi:hypothetical protein